MTIIRLSDRPLPDKLPIRCAWEGDMHDPKPKETLPHDVWRSLSILEREAVTRDVPLTDLIAHLLRKRDGQ